MHQASTCAAGSYFPTTTHIKTSQMTTYRDNSFNAAPQTALASADADSELVSTILTAELALLDMLARLIVDAVQRDATPPTAKVP